MMKLSRGVLGLKFMRRTLDTLEKTATEKKHKQHFGGDVKVEADLPPPEAKVTECPSYLQCERFTYARQSYGGMNPSVEENVRKGNWAMEFELEGPENDASLESEPSKKKIKLEASVKVEKKKGETSDGEISDDDDEDDDDEGMSGPTLTSLIGTIGKRFNRKHDKMMMNKQQEHKDPQDRLDQASIAIKKRNKGHFWNKNKNKNKNNGNHHSKK